MSIDARHQRGLKLRRPALLELDVWHRARRPRPITAPHRQR